MIKRIWRQKVVSRTRNRNASSKEGENESLLLLLELAEEKTIYIQDSPPTRRQVQSILENQSHCMRMFVYLISVVWAEIARTLFLAVVVECPYPPSRL
jgi:hypothetical protein